MIILSLRNISICAWSCTRRRLCLTLSTLTNMRSQRRRLGTLDWKLGRHWTLCIRTELSWKIWTRRASWCRWLMRYKKNSINQCQGSRDSVKLRSSIMMRIFILIPRILVISGSELRRSWLEPLVDFKVILGRMESSCFSYWLVISHSSLKMWNMVQRER